MKESTESISTIYIILFFIAIIITFMIGIINYYKGYKTNKIITNTIENYGGFNNSSAEEINTKLKSTGYKLNNGANCSNEAVKLNDSELGYKGYCVYLETDGDYYNYKVTSYISFSFPFFNNLTFRIPVKGKTISMYSFPKLQIDK